MRREIREALVTGKPLIVVSVDGRLPPSGLPDDIKDVTRMQAINFYPEYFTPGVEKLVEFLLRLKIATRVPTSDIPAKSLPPRGDAQADEKEKPIEGRASLDEALDLMEAGDFARAAFRRSSNAFNLISFNGFRVVLSSPIKGFAGH